MYDISLGRRPAPASRMDSSMLPSSVVESQAQDVVVMPSADRRFRAVISRSVTLKAVVEFTAPETADKYALADDLVSQIPLSQFEVVDQGYNYIESIDAVDADDMASVDMPPADIAAPSMLSKRAIDVTEYQFDAREVYDDAVRQISDQAAVVKANARATLEAMWNDLLRLRDEEEAKPGAGDYYRIKEVQDYIAGLADQLDKL